MDQLFNLEFQFDSVFNLEFQPEFSIPLGFPIPMGINLGECSAFIMLSHNDTFLTTPLSSTQTPQTTN